MIDKWTFLYILIDSLNELDVSYNQNNQWKTVFLSLKLIDILGKDQICTQNYLQ